MGGLLVLLTPGYADWEPAYLLGVGKAFYGLAASTGSLGHAQLESQGGVTVRPDLVRENFSAADFDGLAVPGGTIWESSDAPDLKPLIDEFRAARKPIGLICGATLAGARAGLLDNIAHTSNALDFLTGNASNYQGRDHYRDQKAAVVDDRVVTAPGTAPVSFSVELMKLLDVLDDEKAEEFRQMLAAEFR